MSLPPPHLLLLLFLSPLILFLLLLSHPRLLSSIPRFFALLMRDVSSFSLSFQFSHPLFLFSSSSSFSNIHSSVIPSLPESFIPLLSNYALQDYARGLMSRALLFQFVFLFLSGKSEIFSRLLFAHLLFFELVHSRSRGFFLGSSIFQRQSLDCFCCLSYCSLVVFICVVAIAWTVCRFFLPIASLGTHQSSIISISISRHIPVPPSLKSSTGSRISLV